MDVSKVLKAAIQNWAATICLKARAKSDALLQGLHQRRVARGDGAHGGQSADDQAHIGVEQASQPGSACSGQHAGLGGQIAGQLALNLLAPSGS
jgi:hypothetical protein